jgi:hypothetical protein
MYHAIVAIAAMICVVYIFANVICYLFIVLDMIFNWAVGGDFSPSDPRIPDGDGDGEQGIFILAGTGMGSSPVDIPTRDKPIMVHFHYRVSLYLSNLVLFLILPAGKTLPRVADTPSRKS